MPYFDIDEPDVLKRFRATVPDATWRQLKTNSDVNNGVKVATFKKTGGLCVYCEQKLIPKKDYQIEHFHPKLGQDTSDYGAGVPNRAIEWGNLFPGCLGGTAQAKYFESESTELAERTGAIKSNKRERSCGQKKGEAEPNNRLIDPKIIPNSLSIFKFNDVSGAITPNEDVCNQLAIDNNLANNHVTFLNLDCGRLQRARRRFAKSISIEFDNVLEANPEMAQGVIDSWLEVNDAGVFDHPFSSLLLSKFKT